MDDPVSKFIPEFENLKVVKSYDLGQSNVELEPLQRQPTIRELDESYCWVWLWTLAVLIQAISQFRKKAVLASPDLQ